MKSVLSVRGDKMLAKKADKSYVKMLTRDTPERCVGLVGLREAIDPRWLFVSRSDLVVKTASDTH